MTLPGGITIYSNPFVRQDFYLLTNPDELLSQLRIDQSTQKKQAAHGVESSLPSYGPRTMPFSVEIHASSYDNLLTMEEALVTSMTLPANPSHTGDDGSKLVQIRTEHGNEVQIYAIPLEKVTPTLAQDSQKRRLYTWSMFAEDPTLYAQSLSAESAMESFSGTTFKFHDASPLKFQDGSLPTFQDEVTGDFTISNLGNIGSPPTIIIYGPTTDPVITNTTTGKKIELSKSGGVTLEDGEYITINVATQDVVEDDDTDHSGKVSDDSDLEGFTIDPGENVMRLTDATPDETEASVDISFRSAWE